MVAHRTHPLENISDLKSFFFVNNCESNSLGLSKGHVYLEGNIGL